MLLPVRAKPSHILLGKLILPPISDGALVFIGTPRFVVDSLCTPQGVVRTMRRYPSCTTKSSLVKKLMCPGEAPRCQSGARLPRFESIDFCASGADLCFRKYIRSEGVGQQDTRHLEALVCIHVAHVCLSLRETFCPVRAQAGEEEDEEEELWELEHRDPKRLGTFDLVSHETRLPACSRALVGDTAGRSNQALYYWLLGWYDVSRIRANAPSPSPSTPKK